MSATNPLDLDWRVICNACRNLVAGNCTKPKAAGLPATNWGKAEIGPTLAAMPQHCHGYQPRPRTP